eukprot:TRINITY_DN3424_c0_g1_i3.p1 TRINITY_DN3424_c0_g1~~TRINITY_DN3424_c0_g1_i3.p1  ORF type:complete len:553 (-),score=89.71 TRINITY_DN3424_c0_g1_i3:189-1847(-)
MEAVVSTQSTGGHKNLKIYMEISCELDDYYVRVSGFSGYKKITRTRFNHVIVLQDLRSASFRIEMNQKMKHLIIINCIDTTIQILDSVVIGSRTCELVNCTNVVLQWSMAEVTNIHIHNSNNTSIYFSDNETLTEDCMMDWYNCDGKNNIGLIQSIAYTDPNQVNMIPFEIIQSEVVPLGDQPIRCFLAEGRILKCIPIPKEEEAKGGQEVICRVERGLEDVKVWKSKYPDHILDEIYGREFQECVGDEEYVKNNAKLVADIIKRAKHLVIYTGAGVSTAANIPDYRGPTGVWTVRDHGTPEGYDPKQRKDLDQAMPTFTHYAITRLIERGIAKFLVSTNLDGLHVRSGTPRSCIAEVHGNAYLEICDTCGKEFLRSYDVLKSRLERWSHLTGRSCPCRGQLRDTIAHFTENMPKKPWDASVFHSRRADVALVLGTSMNVQPAASLPLKVYQNGGHLIIVNLQATPYDHRCTHKIYAKSDHFMRYLIQYLEISDVDMSFDLVPLLLQQEEEERRRIEKEEQQKKYLILGVVGVMLAIISIMVYHVMRQSYFV